MDRSALAVIETEFDRSHQLVIELGAAEHQCEIAAKWALFLVQFARVFTKLRKALGSGSAEWALISELRRSEPLLAYRHHARNADEHGLRPISEARAGSVGPPRDVAIDPSRENAAVIVTVDVVQPHIELVEVIDRGVLYKVPETFEGQPIMVSPQSLALFGLLSVERCLDRFRTGVR